MSDFDHISSQNGWFASQKWYDEFLFRIFIRFFRIFFICSYFSSSCDIDHEYDMIFFFHRIYPVSGFFPDFPGFPSILIVFTTDLKAFCHFSKLYESLMKNDKQKLLCLILSAWSKVSFDILETIFSRLVQEQCIRVWAHRNQSINFFLLCSNIHFPINYEKSILDFIFVTQTVNSSQKDKRYQKSRINIDW